MLLEWPAHQQDGVSNYQQAHQTNPQDDERDDEGSVSVGVIAKMKIIQDHVASL